MMPNERADIFKPTHYFIAQGVQLLGQLDNKYLLKFSDGSIGWHDTVLIPTEIVEQHAKRTF